MSNTTTTPIPSTDSTTAGPPTMVDPRPTFAKAVALGREVVERIRPDQFGLPTPCTEFDVRQVAGHVIAVLNKIALLGDGEDFFSMPQSIDDIAVTDWAEAYQQCADRVDAVWSDESVLARMIDLPWAQLPGAVTLMIYINEITVHTWDLAKATGQQPAWDDEVLQVAYAAMQRGLPAEGRTAQFEEAAGNLPEESRGVPPFAEVVPVADDAPLIDRLVAWNGRQP